MCRNPSLNRILPLISTPKDSKHHRGRKFDVRFSLNAQQSGEIDVVPSVAQQHYLRGRHDLNESTNREREKERERHRGERKMNYFS